MRPLINNLVIDDTQAAAQMICCGSDRYLLDHFPGFPVVPGVVLMESFRQLFGEIVQNSEQSWKIVGYDNFRFRTFVRPNDLVELYLEIDHSASRAKCQGLVNGKRVVLGNLLIEPAQENSTYRDGRLPEFLHWQWQTKYEELEFEQLATSQLSLPLPCPCAQHVPDPFIIEGLAQTAVQLIQQHCPEKHITALVKVPSANISNRAACRDSIELEVKVLGVQSQGGVFYGSADVGDCRILDAEIMLTFAPFSDSLDVDKSRTRIA